MMTKVICYLVEHSHVPRSLPIVQEFSNRIKHCLKRCYLTSLRSNNEERARREFALVKSIRHKLNEAKLILRLTDKSRVFHIGHAVDYEEKARVYRNKTGAYEVLVGNPLSEICDKVKHLLDDLHSKKHIFLWQYKRMMPDPKKVKLGHLYFLLKTHKEGTPLRPIISSINSPTTGISHLLDKMIHPLFDKHTCSTTIQNGSDLIKRLETYVNEHRFNSKTLFCTFDITDLYTMLPQEESLYILTTFLVEHGYRKVQNIPLDGIRKLARIIIRGAMGSPFTLTLANIFMRHWETKLVQRQLHLKGIYCRYIDDVFFASNESLETIKQLLNEMNHSHTNIKLTSIVDKNMLFLDVYMKNDNGILFTSIYHKDTGEPDVLSFLSDHPRHIFDNIIKVSLCRAVRYSSTLDAFNWASAGIISLATKKSTDLFHVYVARSFG